MKTKPITIVGPDGKSITFDPGGGSSNGNNPTGGGTVSTGLPKGYKPPPGIAGALYPPQTPPVPGAALPTGQLQTAYGTPYQENNYNVPIDSWGPQSNDPTQIYSLQQQLIQTGYLSATHYRPGVWDVSSATAWGHVLTWANFKAMNAQDALKVLAANPTVAAARAAGGGTGGTPSVVALAPQADIQQTYQQASSQLVGNEAPAPQQFTDYYHGLETAAQHVRGSTYTPAPALGDAAAQYIQHQDPSQVQAYGVASRMQDFFSMLGQKG